MATDQLVVFNEDKARAVFTILDRDYAEKRGVFHGIILPQDKYEFPVDSFARAHWLFYAALTQRGGIISEDAFEVVYRTCHRYPEIADPNLVVSSWSPDRILEAVLETNPFIKDKIEQKVPGFCDALKKGGLAEAHKLLLLAQAKLGKKIVYGYRLEQYARFWLYNSRIIVEHLGGDIRNAFVGATDFEEAFARVDSKRKGMKDKGILGMRRKIFSLLTIWLQESELVPIFPTPIPVDFHALRLFWSLGIIEDSSLLRRVPRRTRLLNQGKHWQGRMVLRVTERFVDAITMWTQKFIYENGFSHLRINPALWVVGRELCAEHFQSGTQGASKDGDRRGRKYSGGRLRIKPEDLKVNPQLWPKGYKDPCSFCPVQAHCHGVIPSGPYYWWGWLVPLERVPYLHHNHSLALGDELDGKHFRSRKSGRSRTVGLPKLKTKKETTKTKSKHQRRLL